MKVMGGLFYVREEEGDGWQVMAACAFPQKVGQIVKGGSLRTAEVLKKPFLLAPPPSGTLYPYSALLKPRAAGILYLPFYSEATGEVVAIVELLLAEKPEEEIVQRLEGLLPRIGTYWWSRQGRFVGVA
ncbi:MAG: hypothetical protein RMK19_06055 [Bacteroidia bacterium]|nr:hypothetical protein [Bacteroidia bacterium]MDW8015556.1 hypothetical protein [Bacteroidia bacterium]